eukprot:COSAG01_NODE_913_length_12779_cov_9.134385_3_plen_92_part_00
MIGRLSQHQLVAEQLFPSTVGEQFVSAQLTLTNASKWLKKAKLSKQKLQKAAAKHDQRVASIKAPINSLKRSLSKAPKAFGKGGQPEEARP